MKRQRKLLPLVEINIGLLADQVGVSTTDTLYLGEGVHNLLLSVNIGVEKTELLKMLLASVSPKLLDPFHILRLFAVARCGGVGISRMRLGL